MHSYCYAAPDVSIAVGLPSLTHVGDPQSLAKVELGQKLFFDRRLSRDGTISCASCHVPDRAFSDGLRVAKGTGERLGTRNTPSLLNVAFSKNLFWDGRRTTLESQAIDPLLNSVEHGLTDSRELLNIVARDKSYASRVTSAFGISPQETNTKHIAAALAAFQRTLIAGGSRFDRYQFAGEANALTPSELRGLDLFRGRAQCATCHTIGTTEATFSDNQFHSLGSKLNPMASMLPVSINRVLKASEIELGQLTSIEKEISSLGRFIATKQLNDIGKFRTPSLRNVALTAPYMHDGAVATLEEAIDLESYYRSIVIGRPLVFTREEKADLVEFLKALTSPAAENKMAASGNTRVKNNFVDSTRITR